MTEAEALDLAAKAAGWRDWKEAHERTWELDGMRAHAKTIVAMAELMTTCEEATTRMELMYLEHQKVVGENAALKAEIERLTAILSEMNDTDIVARTMANFAVAREALEKVYSGAWIICRDDPLDVRIIARTALERIDHGDR